MYTNFYHLREYPFRLTPDPAFVYLTAQHREALAGLICSINTDPGLTVLVGEAGTGKTTLLYTLLEMLEKRRCATAMCTNPTLTREEFYDLLLMKFGISCSSPLKSRQLMALQEVLLQNRADQRRSLLIIDEAHRLSCDLLEEIRLLLNLETPREKLLEIILAGQPELTETLRRPGLRQLKQRVSYNCRLEPLSLPEVQEYLEHRLTKAGLPGQKLFSDSSVKEIYKYTSGIPRLINVLCDSALRTGLALQCPCITDSIIREAARDIDLLEGPPAGPVVSEYGNHSQVTSINGHVVETRVPVPVPDPEEAVAGNGTSAASMRMPLEDYARRQKSLGFLAALMDPWRS